ncbi:one cut domain family member 3-like isoform X1 [Montipora capricornis]|uniref:one cut domain family member 3-like isoform X1 n=1 Tax=Montipora capricornis TaxID=246305 RepID=UPI0035F1C6A3
MANNTVTVNNNEIVQVEASEESAKLKITVEIPASEKEKVLQFVEGCGGKVFDGEGEVAETETPSTIAKAVRGFIQKHPTISVAFFAKEIVRRSQGTLSTLLNNPPSTFPSGAGREPWEAMKKFLASEDEQKNLLERKARSKGKGELSLQAVQSTDTAQTAQTDPNSGPKKRKTFDKMELAAMDTVYKASKGLPTSSMIERLTSSLGLEKDQVSTWFQNHRRLERTKAYTPGQYALEVDTS